MNNLPMVSGPERPPATRAAAQQLVVFLHGWGADGNDLISLAGPWSEVLPDAHFISPHALDVCDENPAGRQWFSFRDRDPAKIAAAAAEAAVIINRFLDHHLERFALGDDRLALVGFSQGAMLALYVALRRNRPCAGVVGYSGMLIGTETPAEDILSRPPILLAHGDDDPVVPFAELDAAVRILDSYGVSIRRHVGKGIGHGIDSRGLEKGAAFLAEVLNR